MNRRQAKKQFKKKYGVNPNKMYQIIEKELPQVIEDFCKRLPDLMNEICRTLNDAFMCLQEKTQEMNSEEFKEFLQQVTDNNKDLAMRLREGGENKDKEDE